MTAKKYEDAFWKKCQRLRLVAFSCHETALRALDDWASHNIPGPRVHLYEYFLENPSAIHSPHKAPHAFVPFVDREVAARGMCLALPEDKAGEKGFLAQVLGLTQAAIASPSKPLTLPLGFSSHLDPAEMVRRLCRIGSLTNGKLSKTIYEKWCVGSSVAGDTRDSGRKECIEEMRVKLDNHNLSVSSRLGWANIFAILFTPLIARSDSEDKLFYAVVPIASPLAFYGVLSLVVEVPKRYADFDSGAAKHELVGLAQQVYLPTLILTQNSWEEDQLGSSIESTPTSWQTGFDNHLPRNRRIYSNPDLALHAPSTEDKILALFKEYSPEVRAAATANWALERALLALWQRRTKAKAEPVRNSLVFRKMMIASPGMLKTVRDILRASSAVAPRKKADDPFPSVLVVGSPGAGKEKVSKLVALFAADYWDAKRVSLNMASIREIEHLEDELFSKVGLENKAVVSMDELNSLDIVTQGGMLRILEEGQFATSPKKPSKPSAMSGTAPITDWLIVGMVNEDPAQLTLGEIRDRTRDTFIFGHLLGALLYEQFKTRSRMRDDLYYRVRRCGEIRVTDLDERREDIPIILYFLLSRTGEKSDVFLTYDALKALVATHLHWKGNVRQLELVAREVASLPSNQAEGSLRTVTARDIRTALLHAGVPGAIQHPREELTP